MLDANEDEDWGRVLLALAWDFMSRRDESVRKLCRLMTKGRRSVTPDDAYSECCERAPMCVATWDPLGGASMDTHVLNSLKWYLYKLTRTKVARDIDRREDAFRALAPTDGYYDDRREADAQEEVRILLESLSEAQARLIRLRYLEELTLHEMAEIDGVSLSTMHMKYNMAENALRSAARARSGEQG